MIFSRSFRVCFAATVLTQSLFAQNLVPNGSFEVYTVCPGSYARLPFEFRIDEWRSLTFGTPDYYNACSDGEAAVPYNWAGVSEAFDGLGYTGIYTWMAIKDFREYLHCKLKEPLIKDSLYRVEFRYKLSSYSKYATDRIGFLLSDSLATSNSDRPLKIRPTIEFVKDSALTPETGSWEVASADYRAKGNEQFLTIGNFSDNARTRRYHIKFRPVQEPMLEHAAYYYIDDVKVIPAFTQPLETEPVPALAGMEPELNTTYVLRNIQFEFNSYALLPESYQDLDSVAAYLHANGDISVVLAGHTDDLGDATYNLTLSENRAKSAAAYLNARGIARSRIIAVGYGESKPLVRPGTEDARAINRRVEITFQR